MPNCRLLLVLLVLLQAGLAALRVHAHPDCDTHTATPHVHACQLLDIFGAPDHDHDEESDHDADLIDLSDALAPASPAADLTAVDFAPATAGVMVEAFAGRTTSVGLPPATAGPPRPLYLTFCTLTI